MAPPTTVNSARAAIKSAGGTQGVAEGCGIQGEVGAQHGEDAGQAQAPGPRSLAAVELPGATLAAVRREFHGGGELPGNRVELPAGVGARGGKLGGGVASGIGRAQLLGE